MRLLHGFALVLLAYSSLFILVKAALIILLIKQLLRECLHQSPCPLVETIHYTTNKIWIVESAQTREYLSAEILLHNNFFQVIQFNNSNKKRILIVFNDQLSAEQLRNLHLINKLIKV